MVAIFIYPATATSFTSALFDAKAAPHHQPGRLRSRPLSSDLKGVGKKRSRDQRCFRVTGDLAIATRVQPFNMSALFRLPYPQDAHSVYFSCSGRPRAIDFRLTGRLVWIRKRHLGDYVKETSEEATWDM